MVHCTPIVTTAVSAIDSLAANAVFDPLPSDYQSLSASEKLRLLLDRLGQPYPSNVLPTADPPPMEMTKLLHTKYLKPSFAHEADELPPNRRKLIHAYGATAVVDLVPRTDPQGRSPRYTGLLAEGGRGLIRISVGKAVDVDGETRVPGVALKMLLDGKPSANLLFVHSLTGQQDDNPFRERLLTDIPPPPVPPKSPVVNTLLAVSQQALDELTTSGQSARFLPCDGFASVLRDGSTVPGARVPHRLDLVGAPELASSWAAIEADFRVKLAAIPEDTVLYSVHAKDIAGDPAPIADLVSRTRLIASPYGDAQLFFQHPLVA